MVAYGRVLQLERAKELAKGFGLDLKSNAIDLSLANPAALEDGTIEAAKALGMVGQAARRGAGLPGLWGCA